jgi:uncharacterized protein (DUF58 family)
MDYRESRHYQAGDDIRNMDWRITARSGHAHVKVFDEERERPVVVLADFGPTMFFASRGVFKSVQAARLAALIGWSSTARGDRIGGLLFRGGSGGDAGGAHQELSPAGGRRGQMRLIRALVEAGDPDAVLSQGSPRDAGNPEAVPGAPRWGAAVEDGDHGRGLSGALIRLRRVARPGSLVFLLTDFYSADAESERHLSQLVRHCDLHAVQVADPLELAPPPPGRYGISDGDRRWVIDTRLRSERERYAAQLEAHQRKVRRLTEANGIGWSRCLTTDDPSACLSGVLAGRAVAGGAAIGPVSNGPVSNGKASNGRDRALVADASAIRRWRFGR